MSFTFLPMQPEEVREIGLWSYPAPYAAYSMSSDDENMNDEMLDRRSPYYGVRDEQGQLVGFCNVGTSSLVWDAGEPRVFLEGRKISIGLGMRPDLTGQGLGLAFVQSCLNFVRSTFAPESFCLYVYSWNRRAIRVYERAGFRQVRVFLQRNIHGENEFVEMSCVA